MGTKALERSRETFQGNQCRFRICQDSVNLLGPFMTKRKILISAEEFKFFVINKNAKYSEIPNQALSEDVKKLGQGTVVLFCEAFNDYIVCQNFNQTVSIMTNKEATESFKIRYFGSDSNWISTSMFVIWIHPCFLPTGHFRTKREFERDNCILSQLFLIKVSTSFHSFYLLLFQISLPTYSSLDLITLKMLSILTKRLRGIKIESNG